MVSKKTLNMAPLGWWQWLVAGDRGNRGNTRPNVTKPKHPKPCFFCWRAAWPMTDFTFNAIIHIHIPWSSRYVKILYFFCLWVVFLVKRTTFLNTWEIQIHIPHIAPQIFTYEGGRLGQTSRYKQCKLEDTRMHDRWTYGMAILEDGIWK